MEVRLLLLDVKLSSQEAKEEASEALHSFFNGSEFILRKKTYSEITTHSLTTVMKDIENRTSGSFINSASQGYYVEASLQYSTGDVSCYLVRTSKEKMGGYVRHEPSSYMVQYRLWATT
ncbi:hypothetical protein Hamer_G012749 [Homarus americanus]|uniref:Uncharacterized protein n=1 Tax=Homarus americanus TaxID=6706 RepID=A0A8J5JQ03_HOMAM|nr:hypothetical protein Hamer_G012749 [Homarus americanus]